MLTETERNQILNEWNDTSVVLPALAMLPSNLRAQASATPSAVAVICGNEKLTYDQLNRRANRLAWQLVEQGVGPDVTVALLAERGIGLLTAILAVFKAGGAYIPLDPATPIHPVRPGDKGKQLSSGPCFDRVCDHALTGARRSFI